MREGMVLMLNKECDYSVQGMVEILGRNMYWAFLATALVKAKVISLDQQKTVFLSLEQKINVANSNW
jgi:hypothetical protein